MAYMNQDRKKKINTALTPVLNRYGVKGSLRTSRTSITLTLRSGTLDFIQDLAETARVPETYHFSVNPYWYQEHFTGVSRQFFGEVMTALRAADWYDDSDISTDYFNTAYYFNVNVGSWDTPYTLKVD